MEGYSLSWLQREREELRRDRVAFGSALDVLEKRLLESSETDIPRRPVLHQWSGARASVGALEMSLHAIERTITEVDTLILAIERGEALNTDVQPTKPSGGTN